MKNTGKKNRGSTKNRAWIVTDIGTEYLYR